MMLEIKKANSRKLRKAFLDLPLKIYKDYPLWVPPFSHEMKSIVKGKGSNLLANGPFEFFVAIENEEVVGRICVGIDETLNKGKNLKHAYFTLFESINDKRVAKKLLRSAEVWAKKRGMNYIKGPVSPTNGDDFRGLLVDNFKTPPSIFMPYNPDYYVDFFDNRDVYLKYLAFNYKLDRIITDREFRLVEIAMKRFNYTIEIADFSDLKKLANDLYLITKESMPIWEEDLIPPTFEELYETAKVMKIVADKKLVIIARSEGRPIGYFVGLPDFSDIIRDIKGKLLPFGWLSLLLKKKNIEKARGAILFVIPEFRNMGVPTAMFAEAYKNAQEAGYTDIEASSISWKNPQSIAEAVRSGGEHYKTYIVFGKTIAERKMLLPEIYGAAAHKFTELEVYHL